MLKPQSSTHGAHFDLISLVEELRDLDAYAREGRTARTLTRSDDLRTVIVVIAAGTSISEHDTSVSSTVQTLVGHLKLDLPDRTVSLPAGGLLVMAPGLKHDIRAEVDSAFLLTLGWTQRDAD